MALDQTVLLISIAMWVVTLVVALKGESFGSAIHGIVSMYLSVYVGTNGLTYADIDIMYTGLGFLFVMWGILFFYLAYSQTKKGRSTK